MNNNDPKEYTLDIKALISISQMSDYQMTTEEVDIFLDKLVDVYNNGGSFEVELGSKDDSIKPAGIIKTRAASS